MISKQHIEWGVAFLAGLSGVITAYYWWQSSRIDVDPPSGPVPGMFYSVDGDYSATVEALRVIGRLNKIAAMWSAITAVLSTGAALSEPILSALSRTM